MQRISFCIMCVISIMLAIAPATAKVYWLPDFLQDNTSRGNELPENGSVPGGSENDKTCATYGMLSSAQISDRGLSPADCDTRSFPNIGSCYTNCKCPDNFRYTSANCAGDKHLSGSVCDGQYSACLCDVAKFPYASCPAGQTPGGASCNDGQTHYSECIDLCDGLTNHDCGEFGCKQTYSQCPSKCEICYTDNCLNRDDNISEFGCQKYWDDCSAKCETPYSDNCHIREDNMTEYGCYLYWQDCKTKCELGKTCTPTDCSGFTLTAAPANASYETCTKGCGDSTVYYKITQCNAGYWDLNNLLCSSNQLCTWKIN